MKLLIIGIDGGTEWIFDLFNMPFWKQLKNSGTMIPVQEDILQRGWARIISGQRATQTGGFYMRPKLDGTRAFTISYNYKDLSANPNFFPVWRYAENAGVPVGIMNVPTTFPAQKVTGFYVSGGGGGLYTGAMPNNAVWPIDAIDILKKNSYIFDTRLGSQHFFRQPRQLCDHLMKMMDGRASSFVDLATHYKIGFGFLAFRASTVLMYLAMSEIIALAPIKGQETNMKLKRDGGHDWESLLMSHFAAMDRNLRLLFETLKPDHFMIVSDHSMVPYQYKANLNYFLAREGFAWFKKDIQSLFKNTGKLVLRSGYRKSLAACGSPAKRIRAFFNSTKIQDKSLAFGGDYIYGIYINDERFGGPVHSNQLKDLTDEIIAKFNRTPESEIYKLKAVPYRANFEGDAYNTHAPDIKIEHTGETFFTNDAFSFIRPNENFGPVNSLKGVTGMHSGQKGDNPLLLIDRGLAPLIRGEDSMDLTLVYKLVKRLFS